MFLDNSRCHIVMSIFNLSLIFQDLIPITSIEAPHPDSLARFLNCCHFFTYFQPCNWLIFSIMCSYWWKLTTTSKSISGTQSWVSAGRQELLDGGFIVYIGLCPQCYLDRFYQPRCIYLVCGNTDTRPRNQRHNKKSSTALKQYQIKNFIFCSDRHWFPRD